MSGEVIFQAHPVPVEVDAYINGTVVDVHPNEGCVIQNRGTLIQGIFGLGGETKGELVMGCASPDAVLTANLITGDMAGKLVVGGAYLPADTVARAVQVGVAGILTGGFDYDDIKDLLGYEVGVAITGGEELGLTIVVTEGFGRIENGASDVQTLVSKCRSASIDEWGHPDKSGRNQTGDRHYAS